MKTVAELTANANVAAVRHPEAEIAWSIPRQPVAYRLRNSVRIATICLTLYWLAIFIGTHLPSETVPDLNLSDKMLHFGAYAGLAFLLSWAIPKRKDRVWGRLAAILLAVLVYGCIDEFSQGFVPGRTSSLLDFLADSAGGIVGIVAYVVCRRVLLCFTLGQRLVALLSH